jgi:thiol-disulfide isomerase/thioredoxin
MSTDENPNDEPAVPPPDDERAPLPEPRLSRRAAWIAMGSVALALGLLWAASDLSEPHVDDQSLAAYGADPEDADAEGKQARLDFTVKDMNGASVNFASYKGKIILLNFWATWCEPCRHEMPSIERLREKLAGKPFAVFAVNVDEPDARVRTFLTQTGLSLPVLMDPNKKVTRDWKVRVLPTTFVIGPDGRTRYRLVGDIDWSHGSVVGIITRLLDGG